MIINKNRVRKFEDIALDIDILFYNIILSKRFNFDNLNDYEKEILYVFDEYYDTLVHLKKMVVNDVKQDNKK